MTMMLLWVVCSDPCSTFCMAKYNPNITFMFCDNTTVGGSINNNDELEYKKEIEVLLYRIRKTTSLQHEQMANEQIGLWGEQLCLHRHNYCRDGQQLQKSGDPFRQ